MIDNNMLGVSLSTKLATTRAIHASWQRVLNSFMWFYNRHYTDWWNQNSQRKWKTLFGTKQCTTNNQNGFFLIQVFFIVLYCLLTKTRKWVFVKFVVLWNRNNKIWNGENPEWNKNEKNTIIDWPACPRSHHSLSDYHSSNKANSWNKVQYLLSVAFRISEGFDCCLRFLNHLFTSRVGHPSCLDNPSTLSALGDLLIVW